MDVKFGERLGMKFFSAIRGVLEVFRGTHEIVSLRRGQLWLNQRFYVNSFYTNNLLKQESVQNKNQKDAVGELSNRKCM